MRREDSSKQDFFCENCGKPVPGKARRCPHCGKEFLAVRCPKCSFAGKPELFEAGCPVCGYSAEPATAAGRTETQTAGAVSGRKGKTLSAEDALKAGAGSADNTLRLKRQRRWLYWLISIFLLGSIAGLIILYLRL